MKKLILPILLLTYILLPNYVIASYTWLPLPIDGTIKDNGIVVYKTNYVGKLQIASYKDEVYILWNNRYSNVEGNLFCIKYSNNKWTSIDNKYIDINLPFNTFSKDLCIKKDIIKNADSPFIAIDQETGDVFVLWKEVSANNTSHISLLKWNSAISEWTNISGEFATTSNIIIKEPINNLSYDKPILIFDKNNTPVITTITNVDICSDTSTCNVFRWNKNTNVWNNLLIDFDNEGFVKMHGNNKFYTVRFDEQNNLSILWYGSFIKVNMGTYFIKIIGNKLYNIKLEEINNDDSIALLIPTEKDKSVLSLSFTLDKNNNHHFIWCTEKGDYRYLNYLHQKGGELLTTNGEKFNKLVSASFWETDLEVSFKGFQISTNNSLYVAYTVKQSVSNDIWSFFITKDEDGIDWKILTGSKLKNTTRSNDFIARDFSFTLDYSNKIITAYRSTDNNIGCFEWNKTANEFVFAIINTTIIINQNDSSKVGFYCTTLNKEKIYDNLYFQIESFDLTSADIIISNNKLKTDGTENYFEILTKNLVDKNIYKLSIIIKDGNEDKKVIQIYNFDVIAGISDCKFKDCEIYLKRCILDFDKEEEYTINLDLSNTNNVENTFDLNLGDDPFIKAIINDNKINDSNIKFCLKLDKEKLSSITYEDKNLNVRKRDAKLSVKINNLICKCKESNNEPTFIKVYIEWSMISNIKMSIGNNICLIDDKGYDIEVAPYINERRTMFPIRNISTYLGFNVEYNIINREICIKKDELTIKLVIGKKTVTVIENNNIKEIQIEVAPQLKVINNKTYTFVPIRLINEFFAFDSITNWDEKKRTVSFNYSYFKRK